jgi:hypothetical protein
VTARTPEIIADDLDWLARFEREHPEIPVLKLATRPQAWVRLNERVVADDLHGLRVKLERICPLAGGSP